MNKVFCILLAAITIVAGTATSQAQVPVPNANYCINPVYSNQVTKPNVMIVQDFSGSMQFPAYQPCDAAGVAWNGYDGTKTSLCSVPAAGASNYVPDPDQTKGYFGYFDYTACYAYSTANARFETSACSCGTGATRYGTSTCISGNVLNWFTTTRLDASRKALTGGRNYNSADVLQADILYSEGTRTASNATTTVEYNNTDSSMNCRFSITATAPDLRTLRIRNRTSGVVCSLGNDVINGANIRVKVDDVSTIRGLVQDFSSQVDFEFMIYNTDSTAGVQNWGTIRSGKNGTDLLKKICTELPYNGTPTGEALRSARDFFRQTTQASGWPNNNTFISIKDGHKDPFWDWDGSVSRAAPCRKAFILLISDGYWNGTNATYKDPVTAAYQMRTTDQRSSSDDTMLPGIQNVTTYTILAFNTGDAQGRQAMITTAVFGGFDDFTGNNLPYGFSAKPASSLTQTYPVSSCDPAGTWNADCNEWDKNHSGLPYNYFEADDGEKLMTSVRDALNAMVMKASSGSGASVLGSFEGSGANLFQALYYPKKRFTDKEITWSGEFKNLWYYLDPFFDADKSGIREDTAPDSMLKLSDDRKIDFFYDAAERKMRVRRMDDSGNIIQTMDHEDVVPIWEAGKILHDMDPASRNIFTFIKGAAFPKVDFTTANAADLIPFMQEVPVGDVVAAQKIISYVRGADNTVDGYRSRLVTAGAGPTSDVWKLGDIVTSTARVESNTALNNYHFLAPDGYGDLAYLQFVEKPDYKDRGMVYVGANDGMLHAFELGKVVQIKNNANIKTEIVSQGTPPGTERWAFIPQNVLPYLTYLKDPDYSHVFTVDGPLVLADVSYTGTASARKPTDGTGWSTVLIGSMGIGGATKNKGVTPACALPADKCVETPIADIGFSSYFALDVTYQANPTPLWEFTHPDLGFSTTGSVIVRVGDPSQNGSWFVVIGSGPSGPIDTTDHQFKGDSNQTLKLFILDLKTGNLMRTIDTGILNAFGGLLADASLDVDRWKTTGAGRYSDDVVYMGYSKLVAGAWKGGIGRLLTRESADPMQWEWSVVKDGTGPVTSAVAKLTDLSQGKQWLYFGTGRYYFKQNDGTIDSPTDQQALWGLVDDCYGGKIPRFGTTCGPSAGTNWSIPLPVTPASMATPPDAAGLWAERSITTPYVAYSGTVYYVTFAPSKDTCTVGGETYLWSAKHDTGAAPGAGKGLLVINLGGGNTKSVDVSKISAQKTYLSSGSIPASEPPKGMVPPKALKRVLHIKEK